MKTATGTWVRGLRVLLGSLLVTGLLIPITLRGRCSAQTDPGEALPSASEAVENPSTQPSQAPSEDFAPNVDANYQEQPPYTDLETDLPLSVLLTPLHWGGLSLLSFSAYEGANSNPHFEKVPLGRYVTSLSGLALYSAQFAGWRMNLQYRPFLWIASRGTFKSFAAVSFDLRTLRRVNSNWYWTVGDRLRYSPTHSTEQEAGFVAGSGGGVSIGNAFLSNGRNVLTNGAAATLTDRYSENSFVTFHSGLAFTRLSSYVGGELDANFPAQQAITSSSGVTWHDHYSLRNTLSMEYAYGTQIATNTSTANVYTHRASIGWNRKLSPSLGFSATAGPAWSIYNPSQGLKVSNRGRTTLHGSLALSKEFRGGGMVLAVGRSDSFTGIISDDFHNRYDFAVYRQINTRLQCSASASYVQQQMLNAHTTNGEVASVETQYFLSRNWAVFAQARYLKISGQVGITAPDTNAILGIRWTWTPENP